MQQLLQMRTQAHRLVQSHGRGLVRHEHSIEEEYDIFNSMNHPEISRNTDPMVALEWIKEFEAIFDYLHFDDVRLVNCLCFYWSKQLGHGGNPWNQ